MALADMINETRNIEVSNENIEHDFDHNPYIGMTREKLEQARRSILESKDDLMGSEGATFEMAKVIEAMKLLDKQEIANIVDDTNDKVVSIHPNIN